MARPCGTGSLDFVLSSYHYAWWSTALQTAVLLRTTLLVEEGLTGSSSWPFGLAFARLGAYVMGGAEDQQ